MALDMNGQGESTTEEGALRPHSYDGIQEYDNPPPRWLMWLFYAAILHSVFYVPYYLWGYAKDIATPQTELAVDIAALDALKEGSRKANPPTEVTRGKLSQVVKKPDAIEAGKKQYATTCASCHGAAGEGLVGPNLTDNAWIHGGSPQEIHKTIDTGVLEKGMLAWGKILPPKTIDNLVAYVVSIQGTKPANAKAPQGDVYQGTY